MCRQFYTFHENIRITEYDERYPNGCKKIHYKRVQLELFAPYLHDDGLVKRLTLFKNLNHTDEIACWQWYRNRKDLLETIEKDFETNQIIENYGNGRADSMRCNYMNHSCFIYLLKPIETLNIKEKNYLILHLGFKRSMERDGEKAFEYFENSRLDGLLKLEVGIEFVREYYEYRQNR